MNPFEREYLRKRIKLDRDWLQMKCLLRKQMGTAKQRRELEQ